MSYALDYGNQFLFGATTTNAHPVTPVMMPEEAWNVDTKMDDGLPARGKVVASYWNNQCAAADDNSHANNDLAASYNLDDSSERCILNFVKLF